MGIGFVLLIYAVIGLILAAVGALVLGSAAAYLTRGAGPGRKRLILAVSFFPLVCLGWVGTVFIFQAIINEDVFHRDAGLGDTWECPLPNGYALLMIDTTDQGWVYNPKTQPDGVGEQEDAVSGVMVVQVAQRYIFGGSDSSWAGESDPRVDSYFLLDTQIGKHTTFSSYDALRKKAQELGVVLNLDSIGAVYSRYRFTWFDTFVVVLTIVPPLLVAFLLMRWTIRLRKSRDTSLLAA
jgi:hypothetical protein